MCTNYIISSLTFLAVLMDMTIKQNGHMGLSGLAGSVYSRIICGMLPCIFQQTRGKLSPVIIYVTAAVSFIEIAQGFIISLRNMTDLSFAVTSVHLLGKAGLVVLLVYQAYTLDRKRKLL